MKKVFILISIFLAICTATIVIASKWSDYADMTAGTIADADTFLVRDVSDTSMAATGTQKEYPYSVMKTDLAAASMTLTNKTFDASGTGNVLKQYNYIQIAGSAFKILGAGVTAPATTTTAFNYGLPKFVNSTDKATNWVDYILQVPPDIDTAVDLTATLQFYLGGADTGKHAYSISMVSIAASAAAAGTPANEVTMYFAGDGSGADGDYETTGEVTLTAWKDNVTAGQLWRIRIARDGDDGTNDTSTVDSYPLVLIIKYGSTQ